MDTEIIKNGCLLMVLGMGTVYFFIALMICCMNITTKFITMINKYFPEEIKSIENNNRNKNDDAEIAIAIACAIKNGGSK